MSEHSDVIGGSESERAIACPLSVKLKSTVPKKPSSKFAAEGTMLHEAMAKHLLEDTPLDQMIGYEFEGHTLTEELMNELFKPALDCFDDVCRMVGAMDIDIEERVAWPGALEGCFGTADIIGWNDEWVVILDWKFGRGVPVSAAGSAGDGNTQLMYYAGAARKTPGFAELFEEGNGKRRILIAIVQPAMDTPWTSHEITRDDLDGLQLDLEDALANSATENPDSETGDHCRWCPASAVCPTQKNAAIAVMDLGLPVTTGDLEVVNYKAGNDYDLPTLLEMADAIGPWCKAVQSFAHQQLEEGFNVDGWKLVDKRKTRQWDDEVEAKRRLRALKVKVKELEITTFITPAAAEKLLKSKGIKATVRVDGKEIGVVDDLSTGHSSGTTMARTSDPRAALSVVAADDDLGLPKVEVTNEDEG
jgi:hypothetical protein